MSERLPGLTRADLDENQRLVYDAIVEGPRSAGPQLFELAKRDGSLNGPFGIMLHAPGVGIQLQELGASLRYRTGLTDREREIAILMVAVTHDSGFEWYAHERVGRSMGLTAPELARLARSARVGTDDRERALERLCRALLDGQGKLDDETYREIAATLGATLMIETISLVGYYRMLAQLMAVFGVEAPADPLDQT